MHKDRRKLWEKIMIASCEYRPSLLTLIDYWFSDVVSIALTIGLV